MSQLLQGRRADDRDLFEQRPIRLTFNKSLNGVEAKIGNTVVYGRILTKVREPKKERKSEGFFMIRVNLALLHNNHTLKQTVRNMGDEVSKVLEQTIRESRALDVESLNIKIGKFCWEVVLDLSLVAYDGNILDAMHYAAMALIMKYEFRKIGVKESKLVVEDQLKKFSLNHVPILQTFAILNGEQDLVILDPTKEEEEVCNGSLVVAVNVYGDICFLHKPGNSLIGMELLLKVIQFCEKKAKDIGGGFREHIAQDNVTFDDVFEGENYFKEFDIERKMEIE